MALKSWLASLKVDVSDVSGVQANIHAGLGRYVTETANVSGVSDSGGMVSSDTADTAAQNQTYQPEPNIHAGCTLETADTYKKINVEADSENQLLIDDLTANLTPATVTPKRLFRPRGPWLTERQALDAKAYHLHHFNCPQCQAAGRGERYGRRCAAGLALWGDYTGEIVS